MNFAELIKPHVVDAVAERFRVKGTRTHSHTKEERVVGCSFEVQWRDDALFSQPALQIVSGGVTGYESFYIDERALATMLDGNGWHANAGGMGYDTLFIDGENMAALHGWVVKRITRGLKRRDLAAKLRDCGSLSDVGYAPSQPAEPEDELAKLIRMHMVDTIITALLEGL